jgi:hypothetical protein
LILQGGGISSPYQPPPPQQQHHQQQPFYPQEQPSVLLASLEQYQGTVFAAPNFNPEADCQALSQAMKGAGRSKLEKKLYAIHFLFKVQMNVLLSISLQIAPILNVNRSNSNINQCTVWYVFELKSNKKYNIIFNLGFT